MNISSTKHTRRYNNLFRFRRSGLSCIFSKCFSWVLCSSVLPAQFRMYWLIMRTTRRYSNLNVHTTKKNQRHTYPYIATQFEANSIGLHIVLYTVHSFNFRCHFICFNMQSWMCMEKNWNKANSRCKIKTKRYTYEDRQRERETRRDGTLTAALMKK